MIRRPPRSTLSSSSAASDVYKRQGINDVGEVETSCNVTVTQAMEEPKFTSLLRSAKSVEGSPIKLEGKMVGHPMPEIK